MRGVLWAGMGAALGLGFLLTGSCALDRSGAIPGDAGVGGASTGPSTGGSLMMPCETAADCPPPDPGCGEPFCNASHFCQPDIADLGTPCPEGFCDDAGNCVECIAPEMCLPGVCTCDPDCAQVGGEKCEGGTCVMVSSESCDEYVCDAAGTVCLDSCTSDSACSSGYHCSLGNVCVPPEPDGEPCDDPSDCENQHCDQGYCCNVACDGVCGSCNVPQMEGTCVPQAALTLASSCTDTGVCEGNGSCLDCGEDVVAPGGNAPTDACSLQDNLPFGVCGVACANGTCVITCLDNQDCQGGTITCPPDFACVVDCSANDSCNTATIVCPPNYRCEVQCHSGNGRCKDAIVNCPAVGTCHMQCEGGNACQDTDLNCGLNDCQIECPNGGNGQQINCNQTCSCTQGC